MHVLRHWLVCRLDLLICVDFPRNLQVFSRIGSDLEDNIVELFGNDGFSVLPSVDFVRLHIVLHHHINWDVVAINGDVIGSLLEHVTDAESSTEVTRD